MADNYGLKPGVMLGTACNDACFYYLQLNYSSFEQLSALSNGRNSMYDIVCRDERVIEKYPFLKNINSRKFTTGLNGTDRRAKNYNPLGNANSSDRQPQHPTNSMPGVNINVNNGNTTVPPQPTLSNGSNVGNTSSFAFGQTANNDNNTNGHTNPANMMGQPSTSNIGGNGSGACSFAQDVNCSSGGGLDNNHNRNAAGVQPNNNNINLDLVAAALTQRLQANGQNNLSSADLLGLIAAGLNASGNNSTPSRQESAPKRSRNNQYNSTPKAKKEVAKNDDDDDNSSKAFPPLNVRVSREDDMDTGTKTSQSYMEMSHVPEDPELDEGQLAIYDEIYNENPPRMDLVAKQHQQNAAPLLKTLPLLIANNMEHNYDMVFDGHTANEVNRNPFEAEQRVNSFFGSDGDDRNNVHHEVQESVEAHKRCRGATKEVVEVLLTKATFIRYTAYHRARELNKMAMKAEADLEKATSILSCVEEVAAHEEMQNKLMEKAVPLAISWNRGDNARFAKTYLERSGGDATFNHQMLSLSTYQHFNVNPPTCLKRGREETEGTNVMPQPNQLGSRAAAGGSGPGLHTPNRFASQGAGATGQAPTGAQSTASYGSAGAAPATTAFSFAPSGTAPVAPTAGASIIGSGEPFAGGLYQPGTGAQAQHSTAAPLAGAAGTQTFASAQHGLQQYMRSMSLNNFGGTAPSASAPGFNFPHSPAAAAAAAWSLPLFGEQSAPGAPKDFPPQTPQFNVGAFGAHDSEKPHKHKKKDNEKKKHKGKKKDGKKNRKCASPAPVPTASASGGLPQFNLGASLAPNFGGSQDDNHHEGPARQRKRR